MHNQHAYLQSTLEKKAYDLIKINLKVSFILPPHIKRDPN